ncbi:MAG: diguanylate cyclase [Gammaproteobacteria bacterium]|nr:diguanylate cyclase [Gammaproteobacteria bacterium]NIR97433.1 diguanylate cyclase [Gammaproteobacteria bacterium]
MAQPITRLLIASFVLVALVPLGLLGVKLYDLAWEDAWREINEKHKLLAMNLAAPLSIYVADHRRALGLLASSLIELEEQGGAAMVGTDLLANAQDHLPGFRSLSLVDPAGRLVSTTAPGHGQPPTLAGEECYVRSRRTGEPAISGIKRSPFNGEPTLIVSHAVKGRAGRVLAVLLGELRIDLIERLRRTIRFGERGHSAIVDQNGRVIAHPNPEWMRNMRDIADWPIVGKMMAGRSGVTEFYSPFVGQHMVAGFAAVPGIGWGIMVPQPRSEVEARVRAVVYPQLAWGAFGLTLALVLAAGLARWIARPLNGLARGAETLTQDDFQGRLPPIPGHAPREVRELGRAFGALFDGLQASRARYDELNRSLQSRVDEATRELRQANSQLERMVRQDHLTALANRRFFEDSLEQSLSLRRAQDQCLCLMLIDVDNFKRINDGLGHAAGDAVLVQLSGLLRECTRQADLVARYGGDEFVVKMHCEREIGQQRAREVLSAIDAHRFEWQGKPLTLTVSIGLLCAPANDIDDAETLLRKIDQALYQAKDAGRNRMVEVGV